MRVSPEQKEIIRKGVRAREVAPVAPRIRGLDRIEIDVKDGLSYRARALNGRSSPMKVDEPTERGGTGNGNTPLAHFLAGAGSCLLNQLIRLAITEDYDLQFAKSLVTGEFRRDVGGGFEHITFEIYADGALAEGDAQRLSDRAEALCYVHNTLRKAIKITTILFVNGQEKVRKVSGPEL